MSSPDVYIPAAYQTTAEHAVGADERVPEFVLSVFPEATAIDIEKFRQFLIEYYHDGLEAGITLGTDDSIRDMEPIEAFAAGIVEGKKLTEPRIDDAYLAGMFAVFKIVKQGE